MASRFSNFNNRRVLLATLAEVTESSADHAIALTVYALFPVSLVLFFRLVRRLDANGPRTRPDLLRFPDFLAISVIFSLLFLPLALKKLVPSEQATANPAEQALPAKLPPPDPGKQASTPPNVPPPLVEPDPATGTTPPTAPPAPGADEKDGPIFTTSRLIDSMIGMALPTIGILSVIKMRGGSLRAIFGLTLQPWRAIGLGIGLGIAVLPITLITRVLTGLLIPSNEAPQKMVQTFHSAAGGGEMALIVMLTISAVIMAPITEEILFRGCFYPMLTRFASRIPAAVFSSVIFALIHDTVLDAPSLAVLAICFTIVYEATGNLLAPIAMHATFNGMSLATMYLQVAYGSTP